MKVSADSEHADMKCLIFRQGKEKQEEKRITFWQNSGKIKMLDTAERLREIEKEETFALLFLNDKGERQGEFIFNAKSIAN